VFAVLLNRALHKLCIGKLPDRGLLILGRQKGPIHPKLNCVKETARKTELNVLWHSTGFPSGLSVFIYLFIFWGERVNSVWLLVRVNMVDKNKAVVCCLLATSAVMLSEKKKNKA
jgi:hypothetical protein